jgi:hypothetical protein
MEISNRTLAFLLVVAIVISIGGTFLSLVKLNQFTYTGKATSDTGRANFTIESDVSISFTTNAVDFGTGYVNATAANVQNCTMDTNLTKSSDCVNFSAAFWGPFVLENQGNINVSVNLTSNATATEFIGGNATIRAFTFVMQENETGACPVNVTPTTWTAVATASSLICGNLLGTDSTDALNMHIGVVIPEDAYKNEHRALLTATATA